MFKYSELTLEKNSELSQYSETEFGIVPTLQIKVGNHHPYLENIVRFGENVRISFATLGGIKETKVSELHSEQISELYLGKIAELYLEKISKLHLLKFQNYIRKQNSVLVLKIST